MRRAFINYLVNKTHFTYSIDGTEPVPATDSKQYRHREYNKFAEFVYLILSEYIILHNYMWAGKMKAWSVKSLDKFLEDIKYPDPPKPKRRRKR